MRQNEETTRTNLLTHLQAIHPANIMGGLGIVRAFALTEFHGGTDPRGQNEHPIFTWAAELLAFASRRSVDFPSLLKDYSELLSAFAEYLSSEGLTEAEAQITRIQSGLALQGAGLQEAPAKGARWREAAACAVAICGAVLLEQSCSGELWRHFTALLALALVVIPVWWMARRSAQIVRPHTMKG